MVGKRIDYCCFFFCYRLLDIKYCIAQFGFTRKRSNIEKDMGYPEHVLRI